jgi:hypothetical protein
MPYMGKSIRLQLKPILKQENRKSWRFRSVVCWQLGATKMQRHMMHPGPALPAGLASLQAGMRSACGSTTSMQPTNPGAIWRIQRTGSTISHLTQRASAAATCTPLLSSNGVQGAIHRTHLSPAEEYDRVYGWGFAACAIWLELWAFDSLRCAPADR